MKKLLVLAASFALATSTLLAPVTLASFGSPAQVDDSALSAPTNQADPIVVTGTLLSSAGVPTSGTVAALAWPATTTEAALAVGASAGTPTVAHTTASANGAFTLRLDRANLPSSFVETNGIVTLEIVGWNSNSQGQTGQSVKWISADHRWVDPIEESTTSTANTPPPAVAVRMENPFDPGVNLGVPGPCVYILKSKHIVQSRIGETYNVAGVTGAMTMGATHTASWGWAISARADGTGWEAEGTISKAVGFEFSFTASGSSRYYRQELQYGKYALTCVLGKIVGWSFKPIKPTAGATTVGLTGLPSWTICAFQAPGTFKRIASDGEHYALSGGVLTAGVIGINLSLDTNYNSSRVLIYAHTSVGRWFCGDNDFPSYSSRVRASLSDL